MAIVTSFYESISWYFHSIMTVNFITPYVQLSYTYLYIQFLDTWLFYSLSIDKKLCSNHTDRVTIMNPKYYITLKKLIFNCAWLLKNWLFWCILHCNEHNHIAIEYWKYFPKRDFLNENLPGCDLSLADILWPAKHRP